VTSLHDIFSLVCSQQHNWVLGGDTLPFCQRCTGLYVGALSALSVFLLVRPKPTTRMHWVHGVLLLVTVPFGYHLLTQTGEIRMLTGQLFAIGLVYYLMLLPEDYWPKWRESLARGVPGYFMMSLTTVLVLQAAVIWGRTRTNVILSWLGLGGLLIYLTLVTVNLLLLAISARNSLSPRVHSSES
jgi:uncharacterized membrane protein